MSTTVNNSVHAILDRLKESGSTSLNKSVDPVDISAPPDISGLNEGQTEFFHGCMDFLTGQGHTDDVFLVLKGFAGSGKSHVVSCVLHQLCYEISTNPEWPDDTVAVSAPVHKAVHNLRRMSRFDFGDQDLDPPLTYHTLHSLMSLKNFRDMETGRESFKPDTKSKMEPPLTHKSFHFCDESSQLADELWDYLDPYLKYIPTIMIGDPKQIPPVGQRTKSKPFNRIYKRQVSFSEYELTEPMRQASGSAILDFADQVRAGDYKALRNLHSVIKEADSNVFFKRSDTPSLSKMGKSMLELFKSDDYFSDPDHAKIITYTNEEAEYWGNAIHKRIFGRDYLVPGEILTLKGPSLEIDEETGKQSIIITNNTDVWVRGVKTRKEFHGNAAFDVIHTEVEYPVGPTNTWVTKTIKLLTPNGYTRLNKLLNSLRQDALDAAKQKRSAKQYWRTFYTVKDYFSYFERSFCKTAHRAQGSTYGTCFVFEDDMYKAKTYGNSALYNSLLYVGVSRAKFNNIIITS